MKSWLILLSLLFNQGKYDLSKLWEVNCVLYSFPDNLVYTLSPIERICFEAGQASALADNPSCVYRNPIANNPFVQRNCRAKFHDGCVFAHKFHFCRLGKGNGNNCKNPPPGSSQRPGFQYYALCCSLCASGYRATEWTDCNKGPPNDEFNIYQECCHERQSHILYERIRRGELIRISGRTWMVLNVPLF